MFLTIAVATVALYASNTEIRDYGRHLFRSYIQFQVRELGRKDVHDILYYFHNTPESCYHPLLRHACLLRGCFTQVCIQHTWREKNMHVDWMINECTILGIGLYGIFGFFLFYIGIVFRVLKKKELKH